MFADDENADESIEKIMGFFSSHKTTKAHVRHLSKDTCREIGLKVNNLEDDNYLQDCVLSIHHSCMELFEKNQTYKIFCNQNVDLTFNYRT